MRIGLLSLPDNFHCRKWALALMDAGASVTVFTLAASVAAPFPVVQIPTRIRRGQRYFYPAFFTSALTLKKALEDHHIDIVYAPNISPFGTWAWLSGFRPYALAAMGADILEHLPGVQSSLSGREWNSTLAKTSWFNTLLTNAKNRFYRWTIQQSISNAAFISADNQVLIDAIKAVFSVPAKKLHLLRWGLNEQSYLPAYIEKKNGLKNDRWREISQSLGCAPDKKIALSPRGIKRIYHSDTCIAAIGQLLAHPEIGVHGSKPLQIWDHLQWVVLSAGYDTCKTDLETAYCLSHQFPEHFQVVERQLSSTEMVAIWQQTAFFVSFPAYDGLSSALLEGSFMGAIPIVSPIPAHDELLSTGWQGIVSASNGVKDLSDSLTFALQMNDEKRLQIVQNNHEWVKKYALLTDSAYSFINLSEQELMKS